MFRPNKHLVTAKESLPALFRPSNQMRLVPTHSANPAASDPQSMLPGLGEVRMGNGMGSNGLLSGPAQARFAQRIVALRQDQERFNQALATGSPNAKSRPTLSLSVAQAMQALPAAPVQGALTVDLAWAGNSIQAEKAEIMAAYQLRPIKNWGKIETYVTTFFGNDVQALKDSLGKQPIVSIAGVRPYIPQQPVQAKALSTQWVHIDTLYRPTAGTRWVITKAASPSGIRFAATLYRSANGAEDEVVRSDNLASEHDARNYIKSYEVSHGDFAQVGRPKGVLFWNGVQKRGGDAAATNAGARNSRLIVEDTPNGQVQPVDGLGADAAALPAWGVAVLALGAVYFISKSR